MHARVFTRPLMMLSHQTYQWELHTGAMGWDNSLILCSLFLYIPWLLCHSEECCRNGKRWRIGGTQLKATSTSSLCFQRVIRRWLVWVWFSWDKREKERERDLDSIKWCWKELKTVTLWDLLKIVPKILQIQSCILHETARPTSIPSLVSSKINFLIRFLSWGFLFLFLSFFFVFFVF